jgi:hypothetical protein
MTTTYPVSAFDASSHKTSYILFPALLDLLPIYKKEITKSEMSRWGLTEQDSEGNISANFHFNYGKVSFESIAQT